MKQEARLKLQLVTCCCYDVVRNNKGSRQCSPTFGGRLLVFIFRGLKVLIAGETAITLPGRERASMPDTLVIKIKTGGVNIFVLQVTGLSFN